MTPLRCWLVLVLAAGLSGLRAADPAPSPFSSAKVAWRAGEPVPATAPPIGKQMTLAARVTDLNTTGDLVLFAGRERLNPVRLFVGDARGQRSLVAELVTDARPNPLQLAVPLSVVDAAAAHDVTLRYVGYRMELFLDGVLVDEDWPFGSVPSGEGGPQLSGVVEQLGLWDRALNDDEVTTLAGGQAAVSERENRYLGAQLPVGQYWRPRGLNTFTGDCMPFYHDGRFHLFYLFDRHHHSSKWGLGAHQWAHASTMDLVHWEHHPMAVPITDEQEGSICTGSVFFHAGTFYAFYAVRTTDGSPAPLYAATSADGVHFVKQPPLARLGAPYTGGSARDPVVFRDPGTGLFHMLVTTSLREPAVANRGGCLARLISRDLKQWEQQAPFLVPGYPGEPECADYFEWHGWYYLVFSNQGVARYRMSRSPLGPWLRPKVDVFDGPQASVMKTAAFTGDRRLGAAFLSAGGYAGHVVFREILQNADGTLGTKWPAELASATADTPSRIGPVALEARQDLRVAALGKQKNFLLTTRVCPQPNASSFGIRFGAGNGMRGGFELRFEPHREKAGLRPADAGSTDESEGTAIYDVTGLDQPFNLQLLVRGDIVDVCVDGRRTLVARLPTSDSGVYAFAQNANVELKDVTIAMVP